jgi:hypothetical protein
MEPKAVKPKAKAKSPASKAKKAKPAKGKTLRCGAVSAYTTELGLEISRRTAEGQSLRTIARDRGMPGLRTMVDWQNNHAKFGRMLDRARLLRADRSVEQISDICQRVIDGKLDPHRGRTAIDGLKWLASKEDFFKYGEKAALAVAAVPQPADAAHNGATPAADELIRKLSRLASNMRRNMTAAQVQEMEARALAANNGEEAPPQSETVEAEIIEPPEPFHSARDQRPDLFE